MTRASDWPELLLAYIAERERRVFEWGKRAHDCCSFSLGWALAATGIDAMAHIEDYHDAAGADLILGRISIAEEVDRSFTRRPRALLQRGDVALVLNQAGDDTLVIVEGHFLVGPGARRLERMPRAAALIGWAV